MASSTVKERLRKLRQKFGLGEYKNNRTAKPKRTKRAKKSYSGGIKMAKKRGFSRKSGVNGMSLLKSALIGIGSAHVAGYVPVNVPYKEEASGAIGAFICNRSVKSAAVGAGAVLLTKMLQNNGTTGSVGNGVSGY